MENKQTAVEWLIIQIKNDHIDKALTGLDWMRIFYQAKQMEKEQIIDARITSPLTTGDVMLDTEEAEHYYTETYKTNKQ